MPTIPGYDGEDGDEDRLVEEARRIGFPVLVKASAGGGGRGMRAVRHERDFVEAVRGARREAEAAFGDGSVFLEKLVENPRHVEVQVIGDSQGTVLHLFERECSIQRRHQKVVEEAPSPALDPALREAICEAAVRFAQEAGYTNAGTVEFLLDGEDFYFLEMNARLQVEHPVTELVTGLDLVHLQLAIAAGEPLPLTQDDVTLRGNAIEMRIYAEDEAGYALGRAPRNLLSARGCRSSQRRRVRGGGRGPARLRRDAGEANSLSARQALPPSAASAGPSRTTRSWVPPPTSRSSDASRPTRRSRGARPQPASSKNTVSRSLRPRSRCLEKP